MLGGKYPGGWTETRLIAPMKPIRGRLKTVGLPCVGSTLTLGGVFLGKESPVDRNWRGFLFANLHGLATNFFRGEFPKHRATPAKGPYLGGARKGYGYLQPEREGLNSGSLGCYLGTWNCGI